MAFKVYFESQEHARQFLGGDLGGIIEDILKDIRSESLLFSVLHLGDTMFNTVQLMQILPDIEYLSTSDAASAYAARTFGEIVRVTIRLRGYLWVKHE